MKGCVVNQVGQVLLHSHGYCIGFGAALYLYVDNRLAVWTQRGADATIPSILRTLDFYGHPVLLEAEPDLSYVGCMLHVCNRSIELSLKLPGFQELATDLGQGDLSRCTIVR